MRTAKLVRISGLAAGAGVLLAMYSQYACSLALDTDSDQCNTDADCTARGAAFQGRVCSPELKVCIEKGGFCRTNRECIDRFAGAPHICRKDGPLKDTCVALQTQDCNTLIGNPAALQDDNVLLLGISVQTAGVGARAGLAESHGVTLAQGEFESNISAVSVKEGPSRPVLWLRCNEAASDNVANINHMVDNLGIPAMVGPQTSAAGLKLYQQAIFPKKILSMSPTVATSLLIKPEGKQTYMYRFSATDQDTGYLQAEIVQKVWEPSIRSANIVGPTENMKVMLLTQSDSFSTAAAPFITEKLQYNCQSGTCKSLDTNRAEGNFVPQEGGNFSGDQAAYQAAIAAAVAKANEVKPHVIILSSAQQGTDLLTAIEAGWMHAAYRPRWVMPLTTTLADYPTIVGPSEEIRTRILGARSGPGIAETRMVPLGDKYKANPALAADQATSFSGQVGLGYDAAWTLLLAVAATGAEGKPMTAENISPNVRRLVGGPTQASPENPTNMANAVNTLRTPGAKIDYLGASGSCDFDENNDTAPSILGWCVGLPDAGGNRVRAAGIMLDPKTKTITNNMNCFKLDGGT